MMTWVARALRGVILVALVFGVVTSTNYLMASTRSQPSAAVPSDVVASQPEMVPSEDDGQTAEEQADDQDVELPQDLTDADLANTLEVAALNADPEASSEPDGVVELVAPNAPEAADAAASPFKRTVIARLSYGTGAASIGLTTKGEQRPVGPTSFAVDSAGSLYVSDNVNSRVQVYSSKGGLLRTLKTSTYVYDLTAGGTSDLYLLGTDGGLVVADAKTGKTKAKGATTSAVVQSLGRLRVVNGQVALETPQQVAFPVAKGQVGSMQLLTSKQQDSGQGKGSPSQSQDRFTTSYKSGGHLYRLNSSGKTIQDVALRLSDIATIVFLQEDRAGNVYVQVERAVSGKAKVEVREFDKKGQLIATVPVDRVDYLPMTRSTVVTEDGTIYQLVPTAQGVTVVKYQRS